MTLELFMHPLSSFCQKVVMALYENDTPFTPLVVDLGNPAERASFAAVWPLAKFPVLLDRERDRVVPESTIILEYLDQHYPGRTRLLPEDPDLALETRLRDRFYDQYVQAPMQKIVGDKLRPAGKNDPVGVEHARALLQTAYEHIDREMAVRTWAVGDAFTMADCAAAPALYYAHKVQPISAVQRHVVAYHERLMSHPAFVRVLKDAEPYFAMFPG